MTDMGKEIGKMWGEMGEIENMVRSVIGEQKVQDQLRGIGDDLGIMLAVWNGQKPASEKHTPAWISKKTRDYVLEMTNVVMGRINEQLGLPYDAMP